MLCCVCICPCRGSLDCPDPFSKPPVPPVAGLYQTSPLSLGIPLIHESAFTVYTSYWESPARIPGIPLSTVGGFPCAEKPKLNTRLLVVVQRTMKADHMLRKSTFFCKKSPTQGKFILHIFFIQGKMTAHPHGNCTRHLQDKPGRWTGSLVNG